MVRPGLTYRMMASCNRKIHSDENILTAWLFHVFPSLGKNPTKEHTLKSPILVLVLGGEAGGRSHLSESRQNLGSHIKKKKERKKENPTSID